MITEVDVLGVYLKSELVTSMIALALTFVLNRLLVRLGAYRHVWHQPLFEVALFVILWGLVVASSSVWLL